MSNTIIDKENSLNHKGFTLVEMSIVLGIIGLLLGGVLSLYKPLDQNLRVAETKERMAKIADAMSSYALRNNRIPCPAAPDAPQASPNDEPFGAERGSGSDGEDIGSCTLALSEGIVPYRTLGLRQEDIIDGFGGYFTYRVSPAFANVNQSNDQVHDHCRSSVWIHNATNNNINPAKARFCCPANTAVGGTFSPGVTDIIVTDQSGAVVPPRDDAGTNYGNVNAEESNPSGASLAVVYTLISHGSNGYGKFLVGSTTPNDRYTAAGVFGDNETENQDGDVDLVDSIEISAETNAYYDDLVLWRTQDSLLSELGTNTCAIP